MASRKQKLLQRKAKLKFDALKIIYIRDFGEIFLSFILVNLD